MRSVAEHQRVVTALIQPTTAVVVPLAAAAGRVLATAVTATVDLPGFDNSAMDGYAVRAVDVASATADSPVRLPVAEDIPAGRQDLLILEPGTAHRIMTGAPLPRDADAVVPVEATDGGPDVVMISEARASGAHVRTAGEDIRAGQLALEPGTVIGAAQIGLLAALGVTEVAVHTPLKVLVLSTGSELVEPGNDLAPGQIYESNGPMLVAALDEAGAQATLLRFVADNVDDFHHALDPHLADADLIVTTGGVSAGAYEVVKDALIPEGITFTGVAMQPGKPQGSGMYRGVPIITFPGNPVSALTSFEVFLRAPLRAAMGFMEPDRPRVRASLSHAISAPAGKRQFRRGLYIDGKVTLVAPPASHYLHAMATTNCLLDIPEDVSHLDAGDEVWVLTGC